MGCVSLAKFRLGCALGIETHVRWQTAVSGWGIPKPNFKVNHEVACFGRDDRQQSQP